MPLLVSRRLAAWRTNAGGQKNIDARMVLLFALLSALPALCRGQTRRILCSDGFGDFSTTLKTGVTVTVGPSMKNGLAIRACDATLRWDKDVLPVVRGAKEVDIDVLGVDLGLGPPVVAFQVRKSALDKLMTYEIYSLKKPPRLLRTITGGDYYDAQDFDLEGRIAIWTRDTGAIDGFENLPLSSYSLPPTIVLRNWIGLCDPGHFMKDAVSLRILNGSAYPA